MLRQSACWLASALPSVDRILLSADHDAVGIWPSLRRSPWRFVDPISGLSPRLPLSVIELLTELVPGETATSPLPHRLWPEFDPLPRQRLGRTQLPVRRDPGLLPQCHVRFGRLQHRSGPVGVFR